MDDISRNMFDPEKHYSSVRMQQGRVIVDDDWNENERIRDEDLRQARMDIIGPSGSPDDGFAIHYGQDGSILRKSPEMANNQLDFNIHAGIYYSGGLRLELETGQSFRNQSDWLQGPEDKLDLEAGEYERIDLVYLKSWQQNVSAIEDEELVERALGGPDTSTRLRKMQRVNVRKGIDIDECEAAWSKFLIEKKFIDNNGEDIHPSTLKTEVVGNGNDPDLCTPQVAGGYLGAENQAIRVQLIDENHFTWGFDNASTLYRVSISKVGTEINVKLHNTPKDEQHKIDVNKSIEVLQYAAKLSNGQYIAELTGRFAKVEKIIDDYNFTIKLSGLGDLSIINYGDDIKGNAFIRVWERANDDSDPVIAIDNNGNTLGHTGLKVHFSDDGVRRPSDYWIIAARPDSSNDENKTIVPWKLTSDGGMSPNGVRRFYAPLAIVKWRRTGAKVVGQIVHDCRRKFPHLIDVPTDYCTIAVKEGDDIHKALNMIKKQGGGCICLLPGDHEVRKPLDFTGYSNIHFMGFGVVTKLHVSGLDGQAPFILRDSMGISFDSFAVLSPGGSPIWACQDVKGLMIKNMFAYLSLIGEFPIISIKRGQCHGWALENNVFIGPLGMEGIAIYKSIISGNFWLGFHGGIKLRNMMDVLLEGNRFVGISEDHVKKLIAQIDDILSKGTVPTKLLDYFYTPSIKFISSKYIGLNVSYALDMKFVENRIFGGIGLNSEVIENSNVHANHFITTTFGINCGLIHGIRITGNRIGLQGPKLGGKIGFPFQIGLRILSDAVDCKILDNSFLNVKEGVVFESDPGGKKEIIKDFSADLILNETITKKEGEKLLAASKKRVGERLTEHHLLKSTFFRTGKCERTLIQGNLFFCEKLGIEWSGTIRIVDFRISNNAFVGCQDVAIQIEPDEKVFFLADPVDTKVRLIEKNRFEVYGGAIRATIGSVRVEKNDIRIKAPEISFRPWKPVLVAVADDFYNNASLSNSIKDNNIPAVRLIAKEAAHTMEKNPSIVNTAKFSKTIGKLIPAATKMGKGDSLSDTLLVMKALADIKANDLLTALIKTEVPKATINLEGFVINLGGLQNRALHNHIYSNNQDVYGGIVFHFFSGEIRDNEVAVPRIGLMVNGKAESSSFRRNAEIVGNSLKASGVFTTTGKISPGYALAIPTLNRGHLFIMDNYFEGSVMVGGDPVTSSGAYKKGKVEFFEESKIYHAAAFDAASFNHTVFETIASSLIPMAAVGTIPIPVMPVIPILPIIPVFSPDPHKNRPVIHFTNNRVVQGELGIFQTITGAYWSKELLEKNSSKAIIANMSNNILDYGGAIVGKDLIIVGNHSQLARSIRYRVPDPEQNHVKEVANIPAPEFLN